MSLQNTISYADFPSVTQYRFDSGDSGGNIHSLIDIVLSLIRRFGDTFSLFEGTTGGMLSHFFSQHREIISLGSGGIIAHSPSIYVDILGIPETLLNNFGVASKEIASISAQRISDLTGSRYAISNVGNAGPSTAAGLGKVGIIWLGFRTPHRTVVQCVDFSHCAGQRDLLCEKVCYASAKIFAQILFADGQN
ncbi:MAG: CinA family protein [Puniceicoccales bacterium]|jgi:PncC family amidohydrolase|nr:CinA family protein [Puniceicoccales bacterium]